MTTVEKPFVESYVQLLNLSEARSSDSFLSTAEYEKLQSLGPSLPKLKVNLPKRSANIGDVKQIKLVLKSIKPPYKFNAELCVAETATISKVKSDLIQSVDVLKTGGVTGGDIKLLVKGKVISDTTVVSSLGGDLISFMAMVSGAKATEKEKVPIANPNTDNDPMDEDIMDDTIPAATWYKISQILVEDLGQEKGIAELRRLQNK